MDTTIASRLSHHLTSTIRQQYAVQFQQLSRRRLTAARIRTQSQRHASTSSSTTTNPNKPIILEQPDKFRPPSHPQKLNTRRTTAPLMGGYNQEATQSERQAQKTRRYPHTFPNEGTVMHRFLTNKVIHVWISLGILTTLALFTLITSFSRTSPFAHLLPSLRTLPFHPITYVQEYWSIWRMHVDYNTEQVAKKRQQAIIDAQHRRLYRRAHGMEDLNAKEDTGVDVRGLVPWDDGLTNTERAKGGRNNSMMTGQQILDAGGKEALEEAARRKLQVERGERENVGSLEDILTTVNSRVGLSTGEGVVDEVPKKKVKRWLGIWE